MKIYDFETFCALPEGILFSYYEPDICRGLFRKGKTIWARDQPIDLFESSLVPECLNSGPPTLDGVPSRSAEFDVTQLFAVLEEADLKVLKSLIPAEK